MRLIQTVGLWLPVCVCQVGAIITVYGARASPTSKLIGSTRYAFSPARTAYTAPVAEKVCWVTWFTNDTVNRRPLATSLRSLPRTQTRTVPVPASMISLAAAMLGNPPALANVSCSDFPPPAIVSSTIAPPANIGPTLAGPKSCFQSTSVAAERFVTNKPANSQPTMSWTKRSFFMGNSSVGCVATRANVTKSGWVGPDRFADTANVIVKHGSKLGCWWESEPAGCFGGSLPCGVFDPHGHF